MLQHCELESLFSVCLYDNASCFKKRRDSGYFLRKEDACRLYHSSAYLYIGTYAYDTQVDNYQPDTGLGHFPEGRQTLNAATMIQPALAITSKALVDGAHETA